MSKKHMEDKIEEKLAQQLKITKIALSPESEMHQGLIEFTNLVDVFFEYIEHKYKQK